MATVSSYTQFGGIHAETAGMKNILRAKGIHNPHTGQPFTEAMLLGISGGLGAGYILWEFKVKEQYNRIAVFGWQNRWQYSVQFFETLSNRLNLKPTFHETTSSKAAANQLEEALNNSQPVVAWVDSSLLPQGHFAHQIAIYGIENDEVLVDDLASKPFRIPAETMSIARNRVPSYKNRLLLVTPKAEPDLVSVIMEGLHDQITHLSQKSDSFSLPTFQKWGKLMTHSKNAKGWPVVFADRRSLYGTLKSVYDGVELVSTGGGGLRGLYADFLDEAAPIVNLDLGEAAKVYRDLAAQWSAFASSALPDSVEPLRETKKLLRQRYELVMTEGGESLDKIRPITERLDNIGADYSHEFPMDDAGIDALFTSLGDQLLVLYEAEVAALNILKDAVN